MNLIKKSAYLLALLVAASTINASSGINKKQAKNYIKQVVYNLFGSNHTSHTLSSMDNFIANITPRILSNSRKHHSYSTKEIYNSTLNKVVNFIEQKSHEYAIEELNKKSISNRVEIASGVAYKIANEVRSIINSHSWLANSIFESYIGSKLKERVQTHINIKKSKEFKPQKLDTICTDICYEPIVAPEIRPVVKYYTPVYQPAISTVYTEYYTPVYQYQPYVIAQKEAVPTNYFYFKQPNWGFGFNFKA